MTKRGTNTNKGYSLKNYPSVTEENGAPGAIRTPGLLIRSQLPRDTFSLYNSIYNSLQSVPQNENLLPLKAAETLGRVFCKGTATTRQKDGL